MFFYDISSRLACSTMLYRSVRLGDALTAIAGLEIDFVDLWSAPEHLEHVNRRSIQGDPSTVRQQILEAARTYQTNDVSIVTNCYYFEDRVRSFELVAKAFDLA